MSALPESPATSPARSRIPQPRENRDVDSSRILAASAHVFDDVCEWVVDHFRLSAYESVPPAYSVDAVELVGQARVARRKKVVRDLLLTAVIVAIVVRLESIAEPGHRIEAAVVLLLSLALLCGTALLLRAVGIRRTAETVTRRYRGRRGVAFDHVVGLVLLLVVVLWWLASQVDVLAQLLFFAGLLLVAWTVVFAEHYFAVLAAQRITGSGRVKPRPATLSGGEVEQLGQVQAPTRRIVAYHHSRGFNNPFVGSGFLLHNWVTNIDIARGRPDHDGTRAAPDPVHTAELHDVLLTAARSTGLPGVWCGRRTYVDGRYLRARLRYRDPRVSSVLPPYTDAEPGVALTDLRFPAKGCRTFVCVQIPGWDGDLVITLFLRAERDGSNLHVTNKIYVLPPVAPRLHDMVYNLPQYTLSRVAAVTTHATRRVLPMLLLSPVRTVRLAVRPTWRALRRSAVRYAVRRGARYDVGASWSVREEWASYHLHSYAWDDVHRHLSLLETALTGTMRDYLEARNVDTAVLDQNISAMIHSQQNVFTNIENLAFAKDSRAGNTTVTMTSRRDSGDPPPPASPASSGPSNGPTG